MVIEKNTVMITNPNANTTTKMLRTNDSQPGRPRFVNRLGMGRIVMVITAASRIGLRM